MFIGILLLSILLLFSPLNTASPISLSQPDAISPSRFFLLDRGCTCGRRGSPALLLSNALPPTNTTLTNITLGVPGTYVWDYYGSLESRALGIDRENEKFYALLQYYAKAEGGDQSAIFSYTYDGQERTKVLNTNGSDLGGLTVARWNGEAKIYYTDGYNGLYSPGSSLRRADLDGSNIETLVFPQKMTCRNPTSNTTSCPALGTLDLVAVDEEMGYVYWSSDQTTAFWRAPIELKEDETVENRTDIELLFRNLSYPSGMKFANGVLYWVESRLEGNHTLYYVDQAWRWKAKYGDGKHGDREAEKELLVNSTTYHGFKSLALDPERGEVWVISNSGLDVYKGSMEGGNMTQYSLPGPGVTEVKGFEIF